MERVPAMGEDSSDARTAMWVFAIAALISGALFAIIMPPLAPPDEYSHFVRAWHVSKGHFGAVRQGAEVGSYVPRDLPPILYSLVMDPLTHPAAVRRALHTKPALEPEVFIPNSPHSWSSPVSYVPQAIGIALGRAAGAPYLIDFYLGRLANLVASVVLLMLAIRLLPSYRWFAVLIALTPMASHVRASLSSDGLTTGISFLFLALVARQALRKRM